MCRVKEKFFREDVKLRYDLLIYECKTNLSLDISDQSCGRQSTNAVSDKFCQTWIPCTLNDPIPTSLNTLPPTKPTESNNNKIEQTTNGSINQREGSSDSFHNAFNNEVFLHSKSDDQRQGWQHCPLNRTIGHSLRNCHHLVIIHNIKIYRYYRNICFKFYSIDLCKVYDTYEWSAGILKLFSNFSWRVYFSRL